MTPSTTATSEGFDFALAVLQQTTTSQAPPAPANVTTPTPTPNLFPLGSATAVLASTLESSFTRFYFDVVPVSRVNTSLNGTYTLLPYIYTDDLFTTNGEIASTMQLPSLTTTSRNFPSRMSTNAPSSVSSSFYGTISNSSQQFVNAFMRQVIAEGPIGTLSLSLLAIYQREIVRGITAACRRGEHAIPCTQSLLYQEIVTLTSDLFSISVKRTAMLLSKVGDGTVSEVQATNMDFSNTSLPNADSNLMLMRSALSSTSKGDICVPSSGVPRNLTSGSWVKSTVADLRSRNLRTVDGYSGRSACNPELWRRYGLANQDELSSLSSTLKKGAAIAIPVGNANEIVAEGKTYQQKILRLLKVFALLRYDIKTVVAEERQLSIADDRSSIDDYLNANNSQPFVNYRPLTSQRRALAQSVTNAWISKAIAFTKALGILVAQATTYEVRVGSALAFGAQRRYNSVVGGDGYTLATSAQTTVINNGEDGDSPATTATAPIAAASGAITRSSDSFLKLLDLSYSLSPDTFASSDVFPSYADAVNIEDSVVTASALLRNPGFEGSVVSLPLDGGNSVADSVAMLYNRAFEDAPWYDGNPLHRTTGAAADNREDDFQGLLALILVARRVLTESYNNEMRKSSAIIRAADRRGQSSSGAAVLVSYPLDGTGVSKGTADYEGFAGISPILPKGEGSLASLRESVSDKATVADSASDDAVVYVLWTSISPQIIIIVITILFAGVLPCLVILWGLKGISLKLRYSHFPYHFLVLFFFAGVLVVSMVLGGTIGGLGIRLIQSQGFVALEGGDKLSTIASLEAFLHSPATEKLSDIPNQLTDSNRGFQLSYVDVLWNSELFHYFSSPYSMIATSTHTEGFPKSLSSFLNRYYHVTLAPMLQAITTMTNETANAALLVGGAVSAEEVFTAVQERIKRSPLKESVDLISLTTDATANNMSLLSRHLDAPLILSNSLVHALKATSGVLNAHANSQMADTPSVGNSALSVLLSSPLFYSGSPDLQTPMGREKALNRNTLVQQLAPFRSLQTLTCVSELEEVTEEREANMSQNLLPKRQGCDIRSQQLLAAMVSNTRSLGMLVGDAIATTNPNGYIISTLNSAGGSLTSETALASPTLSPSAYAVLANSIPEIVMTPARNRVAQIVTDELEVIYDDCRDIITPLSAPSPSCDTSIEGVMGVCTGLLCSEDKPSRYVGYPNSLRDAIDFGALADAFRDSEDSPTVAFSSAFTRQDTPSKGILCTPTTTSLTPGAMPSSIMDAVKLSDVTQELSKSASYAQLMLHDKVTRMNSLVNAVIAEALLHTTRFVVWITIIGIFLLQLMTYGLYRLILFNSPDSRELL